MTSLSKKNVPVSQYSVDLLLVSMLLVLTNGAPKESYMVFTLVQPRDPTTADDEFQ